MIDPITLAVVRGALEQIADEMDLALYRAAFSTIISEGHDACHGFYDPDTGETIVQGKYGLPIFVGVMAFAVRVVIDKARETGVEPGDCFIVNDPATTGTHLNDVKLVRPFFYRDRLFCWLAGTAHWSDVGGAVPGGYNAAATEIFQEGIRIPPVKLLARGRLNQDLLDLLFANNRVPHVAYGDLQAQLGALERGVERLTALLDRYGADTVWAIVRELRARSERMMRARIAVIPDGTYAFEDSLDNDGIVDRPLRVALNLTVRGDEMTLDFSRSDAACAGNMNMPLPTSVASVYIAIKHLFPEIPVNSGCFAPITFTIPATTFLNAPSGKPMGGYTEVTPVIIGVVWGALGQAIPEEANGAYFATVNALNVAGRDADGRYVLMFTYHGGGHGAYRGGDGLNHGSNAISMATIAPVEILEGNFPVRYETWALREDSGGPGTWRGGLGAVYAIRWLGERGEAFVVGDRCKFAPFGVNGGRPALPNEIVIRRANGREERPPFGAKGANLPLGQGDVLELRTPGGGGYGDPRARARALVRKDVRRGYVSPAAARRDYGYDPGAERTR